MGSEIVTAGRPRAGRKWAALGALTLACAVLAGPAFADEAACVALKGRMIPKESITLPVSGAKITAADMVAATATVPAYCKVLGEMAPIDPKAHAILFQVNLPEQWNTKAIQYGGGGMNGNLVTATGPLRDQMPTTPVPLAQGFATMGTDSGHPDLKPDIQVFMLNDEELTNYAHASYKKTYDAAVAVMGMRYGRKPARVYYFGGSEGGREAMSAVQRYPKDYDGVIATVPALHFASLFMANQRYFNLSAQGGFLPVDKLKLVQRQALDKCDKLDGVEDGIIARYVGCHAMLDTKALRCADGKAGDGCLSDAQLALVTSMRTPFNYGFQLANGYSSATPLSVGAEPNPASVNPWIMSEKEVGPDDLGRASLGPGVVRFLIVKDPEFRGALDVAKYRARIQEVSKLMDMSNPDISAFQKRGGKLIMKENTGDYIVSPYGVFQYYDNMTRRMGGAAKARQFTRLYVSPGVSHIGSAPTADGTPVADKVDLLGALDAWVEKGTAPGDLVATSYTPGANPQVVATRPMCQYPNYPHFTGTGDWKKADNFTCRPLPK